MLARLDADCAPLRASVDRAGSFLRIEGSAAPPDVARCVKDVVEPMGYVVEPVATAPSIARWFGRGEVDDLSKEEASVLARRFVGELGAERVIDRPERVLEPLRQALLGAFRDAARSGAIGSVTIEPGTLRAVLDERETEAVKRWLDTKLGGFHPS